MSICTFSERRWPYANKCSTITRPTLGGFRSKTCSSALIVCPYSSNVHTSNYTEAETTYTLSNTSGHALSKWATSCKMEGGPEHMNLTPTHAITQPWWMGRERLALQKPGRQSFASGEALFEDLPGINYCYSRGSKCWACCINCLSLCLQLYVWNEQCYAKIINGI